MKPPLPDSDNGERRGAKMAKFILAPDVEGELIAIADYIAENDSDAADRSLRPPTKPSTSLRKFLGWGGHGDFATHA